MRGLSQLVTAGVVLGTAFLALVQETAKTGPAEDPLLLQQLLAADKDNDGKIDQVQ
jgi:hypothetical protein